MGGWLFGAGKVSPNASTTPPAASLRLQSSVQGKARQWGWGRYRVAGNVFWYGDFHAIAIQQDQSGGGGGKGGGQPPSTASVSYKYQTYVAIGIGEGPISDVLEVWDSHGKKTPDHWNMTLFVGSYTQSPWGYLTTKHPDQALNYRGLAYGAFEPISLGSSPDLPNLSFEVQAAIGNGAPGIPDANVKDVVVDILTNAFAGVGFPSARLSSLAQIASYSAASGLLVSPCLVEQQAAAKVLADLAQGCNFEFRWSNGLLDAVPYGDDKISIGDVTQSNEAHSIPASPGPYLVTVDHAATFVSDIAVVFTATNTPLTRVDAYPGTGEYALDEQTGIYTFAKADASENVTVSYQWAATASYVPDTTPIYDITDDDILDPQGTSSSSGSDFSQEPVTVILKRPSDTINEVKIEYLDRDNDYNPVAIDRKDEAAILAYRARPSDVRPMHFFCLAAAADLSATLQLVREAIPGTYVFTLPASFILVDVLDLLTLTRPMAGVTAFAVRVTEIQENSDGSLTFTCEDYLGTASAPLYGRQTTSGFIINANEEPGPVNDPIVFEPTAELLGGADLQVWAAVCGSDPALYGGCNVYVSFDSETFSFVQALRGPARMGALTAALPSIAENPTGPTIDTGNTLAVDLTESQSELLPATNADIAALASACYVDGEIIAYRDAALISQYNYDLTYLSRGAFGTEAEMTVHPIGAGFARLDQGIAKVPFDKSRVGQIVYLKFQAFNLYGGGLEELSGLPVYQHQITGVALTSPLPPVANARLVFKDNFQEIWWDDVSDFRTGIRYRVYRGDTFAGAQQVGDVAHAPFIAFGTGTFWIVAYCQPVPALFVYSETPVSVSVAGNMITANLVYQSDQKAEGWPGAFSNGVAKDGGNILLGGGGNILDDTDFLNTADILNYGGVIASGTYEIAPADYVNVHYLANCYVNASLMAVGVPVGQDILSIADFLNAPDILGSASTQYIDAKVQIATAQSEAPGDLYGAGDLYGISPDLYGYGIAWSDWQDFVPGVYRAWMLKFRLVLTTVDGNTICTVLAFSFAVSVLPRIDHYPFVNVPVGGATVVFEPDDASAPSPFNGGPPVGGVANQELPVVNFEWSGQPGIQPVIDSLTLVQLVFHFEDGTGTHVAVNPCAVTVEGY